MLCSWVTAFPPCCSQHSRCEIAELPPLLSSHLVTRRELSCPQRLLCAPVLAPALPGEGGVLALNACSSRDPTAPDVKWGRSQGCLRLRADNAASCPIACCGDAGDAAAAISPLSLQLFQRGVGSGCSWLTAPKRWCCPHHCGYTCQSSCPL